MYRNATFQLLPCTKWGNYQLNSRYRHITKENYELLILLIGKGNIYTHLKRMDDTTDRYDILWKETISSNCILINLASLQEVQYIWLSYKVTTFSRFIEFVKFSATI